MNGRFDILVERWPELLEKLMQHLLLTGVSTATAVVVGLAIGILLSRRPAVQGPVLAVINALQTIPSLAMLAILLPLFGIGTLPALIALTLYALLPIVRNTLTGIDGLSADLLQACEALGFTDRQRLLQVELPLALPTIMAGIRTAAVISVGVATLAAFIGAGGLGDFIVRGLAVNNNALVLLGAVPAALLALALDRCLHLLERRLQRRRRSSVPSGKRGVSGRRRAAVGLAVVLTLTLIVGLTAWQMTTDPRSTIRVASKNFTEQYILAELMAQMLEHHTDLEVDRKLSLGSVFVVHNALINDEVDLYPEYTGTAWRAILGQQETLSSAATLDQVRQAYRDQFGLDWLPPFGYENTYAILVTAELARANNLQDVSDLVAIAPELVMGFSSEFYERSDGFPALRDTYGLGFADTAEMDIGLLYQALREGRIDVAAGNSTDGRIPAFDLVMLNDDLEFFPPYDAGMVVRDALYDTHPQAIEVLQRLGGRIGVTTMRDMNREVDQEQRSAASVAAEFLQREGLLEHPSNPAQ